MDVDCFEATGILQNIHYFSSSEYLIIMFAVNSE